MTKYKTGLLLLLAPLFACASTGGDATFSAVVTQVTAYLTGSLGMVFVIFGFVGAAAAIAGFAPMKVMFPVFGLTLALRFGPDIITKIFGATGAMPVQTLHNPQSFSLFDVMVLMLASVVFAVGYIKEHAERPTK